MCVWCSLGLWDLRGSQREVWHRRLLRQSDLAGAGVPKLRSVPALCWGRSQMKDTRQETGREGGALSAALTSRPCRGLEQTDSPQDSTRGLCSGLPSLHHKMLTQASTTVQFCTLCPVLVGKMRSVCLPSYGFSWWRCVCARLCVKSCYHLKCTEDGLGVHMGLSLRYCTFLVCVSSVFFETTWKYITTGDEVDYALL